MGEKGEVSGTDLRSLYRLERGGEGRELTVKTVLGRSEVSGK